MNTRASTERKSRESGRRPAEEVAFAAARRWADIDRPAARAELFDRKARENAGRYSNNIESYIGTVSVPVGLTGPLLVSGGGGEKAYRVPLATTEAALVASYSRGARLITTAGGCLARVVASGVGRTPVFAFRDVVQADRFVSHVEAVSGALDETVARLTAHGRLTSVSAVIEGNHVYLDLEFTTGDAAGQNMVTFAADAICRALLAGFPDAPRYWFVEGNLSGDKKATARSLGHVRGRKVVAEVTVPGRLVEQQLHTNVERMVDYWYAGAIGGVIAGSSGIQGHFANGIAALFLACGQDVACVAEAATGITRLEAGDNGDLYAAVTLPNLITGTVGGGTGLPSARACLDILGLAAGGTGNELSEVCAALVLAGELSIIGAFCSGDFAAAHRALSRGEAMQRESSHD